MRALVRRELRRYSREVRRVDYFGDVVIGEAPKGYFEALKAGDDLTRFEPDPDGYGLPEKRGDGWPFEPRREEWWDVAVVPLLPGTAELTTEQREIGELLASERNSGRRAHDNPTHWQDTEGEHRDASGSLYSFLLKPAPAGSARKFGDLDEESRYEKLARGGDVLGWHVAWREPTGFPPGRPGLEFAEDDLDAARRALGYSRAMYDAVAKRRTRGPLTVAERAERVRLARAVAAYLDAGRRQDGRMRLLEKAYGTNRVTLGRLRDEGRLHKPS